MQLGLTALDTRHQVVSPEPILVSLVRPEDCRGHPLLASDPSVLGEAHGNKYFVLEVRECTILHLAQIGEGASLSQSGLSCRGPAVLTGRSLQGLSAAHRQGGQTHELCSGVCVTTALTVSFLPAKDSLPDPLGPPTPTPLSRSCLPRPLQPTTLFPPEHNTAL